MFEARIVQGAILKKIIEAIRELVTDANLECTEQGITMQVYIGLGQKSLPDRNVDRPMHRLYIIIVAISVMMPHRSCVFMSFGW